MVPITTVEAVGDPTVVLAVRLEVRVEEEKRDPSHIEAPHTCGDVSTWERDAHHYTGVHGAELDGVDRWVVLRLPAIGDLLIEIAMSIEEPNSGEWESPVAGRLQVVAGEDPEATRILGDEGIDAELGRAVGDLRCHRIGEGGVEVGDLHGDALDKGPVTEEVVELLGSEVGDDRDRVPRRSSTGQ